VYPISPGSAPRQFATIEPSRAITVDAMPGLAYLQNALGAGAFKAAVGGARINLPGWLEIASIGQRRPATIRIDAYRFFNILLSPADQRRLCEQLGEPKRCLFLLPKHLPVGLSIGRKAIVFTTLASAFQFGNINVPARTAFL
jgi:hypothetical protein